MANGKHAYYFPHDSNARHDEKVLMLRAKHGWAGYGVYWALVEMMFENQDTCLRHKNISGIAVSLSTKENEIESVVETCIEEGLFKSKDDLFWSDSLRRRKQHFTSRKKSCSEAGKKGMESRWGDNDSYNGVITKNNKGDESKGDESKEKETNCPYEKIRELFNSLCPSLPSVREISDTRKTHLKAQWKKTPSLDYYRQLFLKAEGSNFLTGSNDRKWKADFDFLINPNKAVKVLEGKYDDKDSERAVMTPEQKAMQAMKEKADNPKEWKLPEHLRGRV